MRRRRIGLTGLLLAAVSCSRAVSGSAPPDRGAFPYDAALFDVLAADPGPAALDSLDALEARTRDDLTGTLVTVAEDPALHPLLRANAVLLIGRRHPPAHLIVLGPLLDEADERIRLATVVALRDYLPGRPEPAMHLLARALRDPSPAVRARVLETVAERDPVLLRDYVAREPSAELVAIARELILVAEQRGAALVPGPDGSLARTGPAGHTLRFERVRSWPSWEAAAGRLTLTVPGGEPVTLGEAVEVSRDVVPAFFSPDGRYVVYEDARRVRVRDIETSEERDLGEGIAPRPLPFTGDFVFFRPEPGGAPPAGASAELAYRALRASFAGGPSAAAPVPVGRVTATTRTEVAGGASPVRWAVIDESGGRFTVRAEGLTSLVLPDPFEGSGR